MSTSSWSWSDPDAPDTPPASEACSRGGLHSYDETWISGYESGSYLSDELEEADVQDVHKLTTLPIALPDGTANYQESRVKEWLLNQPSLSYDAVDSAVEKPVTPAGSEDGDEGGCSLFYHEDEDADSESSSVTDVSDVEVALSVESGKGGVVVAEGDDYVAVVHVHEAERSASEEGSNVAGEKDVQTDGESCSAMVGNKSLILVKKHPAISTPSTQLVLTLTATAHPAPHLNTMLGEAFLPSLQHPAVIPQQRQITTLGHRIPIPSICSTIIPQPLIPTLDLLLWAKHFHNNTHAQDPRTSTGHRPRLLTGVFSPYLTTLPYVEDDVFGFEGVLAQFPDGSVERYADGANLGRFGYL